MGTEGDTIKEVQHDALCRSSAGFLFRRGNLGYLSAAIPGAAGARFHEVS